MQYYDVFNGDADGICSLLQLRLKHPVVASLITGVKRDIKLLGNISVLKGDYVTVLDISMDKNKQPLKRILRDGASVLYIDHHITGSIPKHKSLHSVVDTSPAICTSLLTNDYVKGQFAKWAIVGAFGDNLIESATKLSQKLGIKDKEKELLNRLGIAINYNGYGLSIDDLHYHPADLFKLLFAYHDPLECIIDKQSVYGALYSAYESDIAKASLIKAEYSTKSISIYMLPNEPWVRRVTGVFGNTLANKFSKKAHAIVSHHPEGGYVVSVRAPKEYLCGAGSLCQQFATGGGREGAGGINQLPSDQFQNFIDRFEKTYDNQVI